jgi:hypothetical protein
MKNLRCICDEKILAIPVSEYEINRCDALFSLCMVEVRGSNPLSPTRIDKHESTVSPCFLCFSRGLKTLLNGPLDPALIEKTAHL